jgi:hypothetical protein
VKTWCKDRQMASLSCPVELNRMQDFNPVNVFKPFENTEIISLVHLFSPRFGKTNELMDFMQRRGRIETSENPTETATAIATAKPIDIEVDYSNQTTILLQNVTIGQQQQQTASKTRTSFSKSPSDEVYYFNSHLEGASSFDATAIAAGRDYAIGALGLSIAVGCFFVVWIILLLGCYCAGYKRVGILSGRRVGPPLPFRRHNRGAQGRDYLLNKEHAMVEQAIEQSKQKQQQLQQSRQHDKQQHFHQGLLLRQQPQEEENLTSATGQPQHSTPAQPRRDQLMIPKDEKSIASMPDFSDDDTTTQVDYPTLGHLLGSLDEEPYDDTVISPVHDQVEPSPLVLSYNLHPATPQKGPSAVTETLQRQTLLTHERRRDTTTPIPKLSVKDASPRYERYRQYLTSGVADDQVILEGARVAAETKASHTQPPYTTTNKSPKMMTTTSKQFPPSTPTTPSTHDGSTTTTESAYTPGHSVKKTTTTSTFLPSNPSTPSTHGGSTTTTESAGTGRDDRPFLPDVIGVSGGGGPDDELPLSHYESAAVARKRVIEEYVRSRSTRKEFRDFWAPEEQARTISSPLAREEEKEPEEEEENLSSNVDQATLNSIKKFFHDSNDPIDSAVAPVVTTNTNMAKAKSVRFDLDDDQARREWRKEVQASEAWLRPIRLALVIVGLCLVVAVILCAASGVDVLWKSFDQASEGLTQLQLQTVQISDALKEITQQQALARNVTAELLRQVNADYCPRAVTSLDGSLCPNVTEANWVIGDCDVLSLDGVVLPHKELLKGLIHSLGGGDAALDALFPPRVEHDMLQDLTGLEGSLRTLEQALEYAPHIFWGTTAVVDVLGVLCVALLFGILLAYLQRRIPPRYILLRSRLIIPLFVLLLLFELVATLGWIVSAVSASDFCIDSPDPRVQLLLERHRLLENATSNTDNTTTTFFNEDHSAPTVYSLVTYYVSSCPAERFPHELDDRVTSMTTALAAVSRWNTAIVSMDPDALETTCGTVDLAELQKSASIASLVLCMLIQSLVRPLHD